ncbi:MAG: penicillin-binding protein 2 [Magnetovibrionaceae bacterium]
MPLHRDPDRQRLFTRRSAVLGGAKALMLAALGGRMYYLQVVESDKYKTLAEENRINLRLLPPPRGQLLDRYETPVAVNQRTYRVLAIREDAGDVEKTLMRLGRVIHLPESEFKRVLREMRRKRAFVPVTVRENLDWEEVARVEVNAPDLPGITIDVGESRYYPHGPELAHVLGYVASVSEGEATGDPLLELPGFRIGKDGLEKIHDLSLRGSGGTSQVEVNAVGRVIRELSRIEGQPGEDVALSLDLELQQQATKLLADQSGSCVVLDVNTGEVLCMVSSPSYDPNSFNAGLSTREWRSLLNNPRAPLINKAIAGQYAPGSTFKMLVALAALEKGVVTPSTRFFCPGHLELGERRFHCWKRHGHGSMDLYDSIVQSCDIYFYEIARKTGIDNIADMARRLGLGAKLNLDLPGEKAGLIPTRAWKKRAIGESWQVGETFIAGIGQGYVLTTPLQLAVMTAMLANGGKPIVPHLTRGELTGEDVAGPEGEDGSAEPPKPINPNHMALIRAAMVGVVNDPEGGTAFRSRIKEEGMELAGKTGTAQVRRISKAERESGVRKNEELDYQMRDHSLFVGYAPHGNPRFAAAVVVEHGGSGSKVAAPIASRMLELAQLRHREKADPVNLAKSPLVDAPVAPGGDVGTDDEGA